MKKTIITLLVASSLITPTAFAQGEKTLGAVTNLDFKANPAILRSNLFYDIVDLRWDVKNWFTSNALEEAVLKSHIINQKAAEYTKLRSIARNGELVRAAASEYQWSVFRLDRTLRHVTADDVSKKPQELSQILGAAVLHLRFTDDILGSSASSTEQADFLEVQDLLVSATLRTVFALSAIDTLREVMVPSPTAEVAPITELRTAEVAGILAAAATEESIKIELEAIRNELLVRVAPHLSVTTLNEIAGTEAVRAASIELLSL